VEGAYASQKPENAVEKATCLHEKLRGLSGASLDRDPFMIGWTLKWLPLQWVVEVPGHNGPIPP